MMSVLESVKRIVKKHRMFRTGEVVLIAVSGGPDSLCLLHVLHTLSDQFNVKLYVAHLEHGIRGEGSVADAAFVADLAREWELPCTVERRDVPAYAAERRIAIEEAAREVRYAFLAEVALAVGANKAALGHHADDQVETILMNLLRGTGPRGLRGMRPVSRWPFSPGKESGRDLQLIRPLLYVSRAEIETYCNEQGLTPRFDHTNLDITYLRNRIRHHLIPVLESYNPAIRAVLQRMGATVTDDYDYLHRQVLEAWKEVATEVDGVITFSLSSWCQMHLSLRRGLLREAIRRTLGTLQDIESAHIETGLTLIREKPTGSLAHLPGGLRLHKSYEHFTLGKTIPLPDVPQLAVDRLALTVPGTTRLPDNDWCVEATTLSRSVVTSDEIRKSGPWTAHMDRAQVGNDLILRQRRPGDRFQPLGLGGRSKSVREFMIDAKIPAGIRSNLPLVVSAERIVWIPGWRLDERMRITENTRRILRLAFQHVEEIDAEPSDHPTNDRGRCRGRVHVG